MDPVAHTLFGAALAESGLKRRSRYATATLLVGANLPDVDVIAGFWGADTELYFRRGWTHGVLSLCLLPLVLAGAIALWNRFRGRAPPGDAAEWRPGAIVALSYLAVWSHPLLDWLNTYGVRVLMPFDGRWFYGDTLFIVDPWFWLLMAAGVVLARSDSRSALAGWALLGILTTWLVVTTDQAPVGVKVLWCVGVAVIVVLRWRRQAGPQAHTIARIGLAGLVLHVGSAYGLARLAEAAVAERFPAAQQVQASPAPGVPFEHRHVVVEADRYRLVATDGTVHELPRQQPDAIVQQALASPSIRGFVNWMRFPWWTIDDAGDRWRVTIYDLRYQGPDVVNPRGIGVVSVDVPKE